MKKLLAILVVLLMLPVGAMGSSYIELESIADNGNCAVTVFFNNPFGGKTTFLAFHENYELSGSSVIMGQAGRTANSYTFYDLAPGELYTIYAMNETDTGTADGFDYTVAYSPQYAANDIRLYDVNLCYFRPDSVQGDYGYNYANDLSASKVQRMLDEQNFMIKVDFKHNVFSSDFEQRLLTVVKSPSGHVATAATNVTIHGNSNGFGRPLCT